METQDISGKKINYLSRSKHSQDRDMDKYIKSLGKKEQYKNLYAPLFKSLYR